MIENNMTKKLNSNIKLIQRIDRGNIIFHLTVAVTLVCLQNT